jgi:hypothetical protein
LVPLLSDGFFTSAGRRGLGLATPSVVTDKIAALQRTKQVHYLQIEDLISRKDNLRWSFTGDVEELRRLVRGRTPELYAPIRAALIDVARYESRNFRAVVTQMSSRCAIWPVELESKRLIVELQKTRQADFLLRRLIEFLDVSGLLGDALGALRKKSSLQRVKDVANLFALYDELLLAGATGEIRAARKKRSFK